MSDPITEALKAGGKTAPVLRKTLVEIQELAERLELLAAASTSNSDPRRADAYARSARSIRATLERNLTD